MLNTTWVETGFRVAFAPWQIPLKGVGDGTLYAFSDLPGIDRQKITLIKAAVASARFPMVAPPWTVKQQSRKLVWNFVDGAYADNSGSTTALEIYKALEPAAKEQGADLYLVILTDAVAAPDPRLINGSNFSDTVAPLTALLNVRGQLASRAVTQAIEYFERLGLSKQLLVAKLEQRSVPLSLGWKISRTEIDLVRLMLGDPDLCGVNVTTSDKDIAETVATIIGNSCVKKRIADLLSSQGK